LQTKLSWNPFFTISKALLCKRLPLLQPLQEESAAKKNDKKGMPDPMGFARENVLHRLHGQGEFITKENFPEKIWKDNQTFPLS
jgi:hypothetical protein